MIGMPNTGVVLIFEKENIRSRLSQSDPRRHEVWRP